MQTIRSVHSWHAVKVFVLYQCIMLVGVVLVSYMCAWPWRYTLLGALCAVLPNVFFAWWVFRRSNALPEVLQQQAGYALGRVYVAEISKFVLAITFLVIAFKWSNSAYYTAIVLGFVAIQVLVRVYYGLQAWFTRGQQGMY